MALNKLEIIQQIESIIEKTPEMSMIVKYQKQNLTKILTQHKEVYYDESCLRLIIDIYDYYINNKYQGNLMFDLEGFLKKILDIKIPHINSFHNEINRYSQICEQINATIGWLKKDMGETDPSNEIALYTFKMY